METQGLPAASRRRLLGLGTAGLLLGGWPAGRARGGEFPDRPIRVIVPYAAGGGDYEPRELARLLAQLLGQPLVIDNRDGAGAAIGVTAARNAPADGYTLLWVSNSAFTVVPHMRRVGYAAADFVSLGNTTGTPLILVSRPGLPYRTLAEMIAYARSNPGAVRMASAGAGTSTHIVGEALQMAAGIQFLHVPFRGLSGAMVGLLGDNSDILIGLPGPMMPNIREGRMIVLASTGQKRSPYFPDVPTLNEAGLDVVEETKFGWYGQRSLPEPVRARLTGAVRQAVADPEFARAMERTYANILYLDPAAAEAAIGRESLYWAKLLQDPRFRDIVER